MQQVSKHAGIVIRSRSISDRFLRRAVSWGVGMVALITYCLTLDRGASFWDCPEYIVTAFRLEPGHPPGNPVWMLVAHMFTLLAGSPQNAAVAVNLSSALFMAAGAGILASVIWLMLRLSILPRSSGKSGTRRAITAVCSAAGALCFAWADSPWFSAVEAEVYAFSLFLTALSIRLMLSWALMRDRILAGRFLMLAAYVMGLSIGVHQLNLLAIPAMSLIWFYRRHPRPAPLGVAAALAVSFLIVAAILFGMMPGVMAFARRCELFCVNSLGWPYHSGVWLAWAVLLLTAFLVPVILRGFNFRKASAGRPILMAAWLPLMLLTGYSSYFILLVRGAANPPMNEGAPSDIFAFSSYLARDQYGSSPLFYGRTPYSAPMRIEKFDSAGNPSYTQFARRHKGRIHTPRPDASLPPRYVDCGEKSEFIYTPELNMILPRLTSGDPADIEAYADWAGMRPGSMDRVPVSCALDSAGNPVARMGADGRRHPDTLLRPTYLQQLRYLGSYQISYMYLRYLMWNFSGRQNDRFAGGETEHGNFITGIPPVDSLMLGPQDTMPDEIGGKNPGRNVYFMIPLILGILGILALADGKKLGARRWNFIIFTLFFMTGIAIVIYLNQNPREPRERDYSFLGSFWAYSIWIAAGMAWIWRSALSLRHTWLRRSLSSLCAFLAIATPLWMLAQNHDDHDRSLRRSADDLAANFLNNLDPGAIVFVNGDNYTFPLWYAQEVLGIRRDVTVVNTAYLTTSWYALQLQRPGEVAGPLAMQAPAAGLALNRYPYVFYRTVPAPVAGESPASIPTVDALQALRSLYADTVAPHPFLPALLRLPAVNGDSIVISAKDIAGGRGYIPAAALFTLDIVASNAASASPRPVYWLDALPGQAFAGFRPYTFQDLYSRRLLLSADSIGRSRLAGTPRPVRILSGGADRKGFRADATVGNMITRQRMGLVRYAARLLRNGHAADALAIARLSESRFPAEAWEYQIVHSPDSIHHEGIELARILIDAGSETGDSAAVSRGRQLLRREQTRYESWRRYRLSLPPRLRHFMTPKNNLKARGFPE